MALTFQLDNDVALASNVFLGRRNMFLCLREVAFEHFSVHRLIGQGGELVDGRLRLD